MRGFAIWRTHAFAIFVEISILARYGNYTQGRN